MSDQDIRQLLTAQRNRFFITQLSIGMLGNAKKDYKASRELAAAKNAKSKMVRVNKTLFSCPEYDAISKHRTDSSTIYQDMTQPWGHFNQRIIEVPLYPEYVATLSGREQEYKALVEKFCDVYIQVRQDARNDLQGMYDPNDYKSLDEVRAAFKFIVAPPMPLPDVPTAGDFIGLPPELVDEIVQAHEQDKTDAVDGVKRRVCSVLISTIDHAIGQLTPEPGKKKRLHDSVLNNIRDSIDTARRMNIDQDPRVEQAATRLDHLLNHVNTDALRGSEATRTMTVDALAKVRAGLPSI